MSAAPWRYRSWDSGGHNAILLECGIFKRSETDDRLFGALSALLQTALDAWLNLVNPLPFIIGESPVEEPPHIVPIDPARYVQYRTLRGTCFDYRAKPAM